MENPEGTEGLLPEESPVPVKVKGVYIAETVAGSPSPVVILEDDQSRIVPIFVGITEAISIHHALAGEVSPRPMTHDLFISALECLKAQVSSVLIDDLDGGVYYARLSIKQDSVESEIDARPSDCIALALRSKSPICIQEQIVEDSSIQRSDLENLRTLESYLQ